MQQNSTLINDPGIIERISSAFILKDHIKAIEKASIEGKFAVTFREAGKATLDKLKLGAAAKGHDILEKTIKESSIKKSYKESFEKVLRWMKDAEIEGYVGHWDKNTGLLKGIYLSKSIEGAKKLEDHQDKNHPTHFYWPVDTGSAHSLNTSLQGLKARKDWKKIPFTGDYDMHDMITFRNGRARTAMIFNEKTPHITEEKDIIDLINAHIAMSDPDFNRQFDVKSHNVIRHGAQVNFTSHMMINELDKVKVDKGFTGAVARPGEFPLAAINKGKWSIIENLAQLQKFYKDCGANIKESWKPEGSVKYGAITNNRDRVYFKRSANDISDPGFKGHGRTPIALQKRNSSFFNKVQPVFENSIMPFKEPKLPSGEKIETLSARSVNAAEKKSKVFNQNSQTVFKENQNLPDITLLGKRESINLDIKAIHEEKTRRRSLSTRA